MPDRANDGKPEDGRRLAVLRFARGLEQKDLAQRARMAPSTISKIEQGRDHSPETWERLLEALHASAWDVKRSGWFVRRLSADVEAPGCRAVEAAGRAIEGLVLAMEDQAIARIARRASAASAAAQGEAFEHWSVLRPFAVEELRRLIEDSAVLQTTTFLEALCAESERVARSDPKRAAALAELALDMAAWVPLADEQQRPEYQALALAFLANAYRAQGCLLEAKDAFQASADLWQPDQLARSALDGTRILDLRASLLRAERRLPEALALLNQALELGPRGPEGRARLLIKKAKAYEELKQPEVALGLLEQAETLLGKDADPHLVYAHRNILVVNLWLLGKVEEAERRLGEVRALAEKLGNDLDLLRLGWVEARIDAALGRRVEAIEKLRRVREEFQERAIPYDTALVTLELSALLLSQGQTGEVKELAEEMLKTFAEQEVPQEAEKALRIFCEAAVQETATVELVRRLIVEVERRS